MKMHCEWKGRMLFSAVSGDHQIAMDSNPPLGLGQAMTPKQLLVAGICGCTAMDVISILHKKRQDVTAFEVRVHTRNASEHPKVFTDIMLEYIVTGHGVDPAALERAMGMAEEWSASSPSFRPTMGSSHVLSSHDRPDGFHCGRDGFGGRPTGRGRRPGPPAPPPLYRG